MRTVLVLTLIATTACSAQHRVDRMNRGAKLREPASGHEVPPSSKPLPPSSGPQAIVQAPAPGDYTPARSALID